MNKPLLDINAKNIQLAFKVESYSLEMEQSLKKVFASVFFGGSGSYSENTCESRMTEISRASCGFRVVVFPRRMGDICLAIA